MADVFVSFRHEDHEYAVAVGQALQARGASVFIDDSDLGPEDERVARELNKARAVVVLWSRSSRNSQAMRKEARSAMQRGALFSCRIDQSDAPDEFASAGVFELHEHTLDPFVTRICAAIGRQEVHYDPATVGKSTPAELLRDVWVRIALALAIALPFYFLAAALGGRLGLFDWRFAFETMALSWGRGLIFGTLLFALIGLVLSFAIVRRRGRRLALLGVFVPALALGYALYTDQQRAAAAPIHDVSTDTLDPPQFSAAVQQARARIGGNALDYLHERAADGRTVIDVQRASYPELTSIPTGLAPNQAYEMARQLAHEKAWRITRENPQAGSIEAISESFWFGFVDDVVVRVRPDGSGARIDMRSSSRVGDKDGGANARRMRPFLDELRKRVQDVES